MAGSGMPAATSQPWSISNTTFQEIFRFAGILLNGQRDLKMCRLAIFGEESHPKCLGQGDLLTCCSPAFLVPVRSVRWHSACPRSCSHVHVLASASSQLHSHVHVLRELPVFAPAAPQCPRMCPRARPRHPSRSPLSRAPCPPHMSTHRRRRMYSSYVTSSGGSFKHTHTQVEEA